MRNTIQTEIIMNILSKLGSYQVFHKKEFQVDFTYVEMNTPQLCIYAFILAIILFW